VLFTRVYPKSTRFSMITSSNRRPTFTLCHNYFSMLYEMQSGTLLQQ